MGRDQDWASHGIEHELSAYYDITHGVGLAIVTPRWMRHILSNETVDKFVEFANHVWNIYGEDKYEVANKGIDALENFFKEHAKNYPDGLLIQADDNSEHGTIVKVMDSARNVGITSISLSRG